VNEPVSNYNDCDCVPGHRCDCWDFRAADGVPSRRRPLPGESMSRDLAERVRALLEEPHHLGFPLSGKTGTYDSGTVMVKRDWHDRLLALLAESCRHYYPGVGGMGDGECRQPRAAHADNALGHGYAGRT
jgi:hypothetical protein